MSYSPTNWAKGDVVTSAKLNKLEQGVAAAGPFIFTVEDGEEEGTVTIDATFAEISAAIAAGRLVYGDYYGTLIHMVEHGGMCMGTGAEVSSDAMYSHMLMIAGEGAQIVTAKYTLTPET